MPMESLWTTLRALGDRWDFSLLMGVVGVATTGSRWRRQLAPLALSSFGFLFRKLFLFVPVCGAVSTADDVVFWSGSAYAYFAVVALVIAATCLLIQMARNNSNGDELPQVIATLCVLLLVASGALLPVDGGCHFYMPAACSLAVPKLLLVTPALLWCCWAGLLFQVVALVRPSALSRAFSGMLVVTVVSSGLASYGAQVLTFLPMGDQAPIVQALRGSPSRILPGSKSAEAPKEAEHFLRLWKRAIPDINRTGLNVVEKDLSWSGNIERRSTPPLAPGALVLAGVVILLLVFLAILSEGRGSVGLEMPPRSASVPSIRVPGKGAKPVQVPEDPGPVIAMQSRSRMGFEGGCLVVFAALTPLCALGPLILGRWDTFGEVVFAVVGLSLLPGIYILAMQTTQWLFIVPERDQQLRDFVIHERRGRTRLGSWLLGVLADPASGGSRLLVGQPQAILLDCLVAAPSQHLQEEARRALDMIIRAPAGPNPQTIPPTAYRESAAIHPECPKSIRLDLTKDAAREVRTAALVNLGRVSRLELDSLIRSPHADVRSHALRQPGITRREILDRARRDPDADCRAGALQRLGATSSAELRALLHSKHADVRAHAVVQPQVDRWKVVKCARKDPSPDVRKPACQRLGPLSIAEVTVMARSKHEEAVRHVIGQEVLWRSLLLRLSTNFSDEAVRKCAQERLGAMFANEGLAMARSSHADARIWAITQRAVDVAELLRLASRDEDFGVRTLAQGCLSGLLPGEISTLANSKYPDARKCAVKQDAIERRDLLRLVDGDPEQLSKLAQQRLGDLTPEEASSMARSIRPQVRTFAAGQPAIGRDDLLRLATGDQAEGVRTLAQHRLPQLFPGEVSRMVRSNYPAARSKGAKQPTIRRTDLLRLAGIDPMLEVREIAQGRLLDLSAKEALTMLRSQYKDARIHAVRRGGLTQVQLQNVVLNDPDSDVRAAAQDRLPR